MNTAIAATELSPIEIIGDQEGTTVKLELMEEDSGVYTYLFDWTARAAIEPQSIRLKWKLPAINVKGVWKPGGVNDKRLQYDWELEHVQSRVSVDAPVISIFGHQDENILTFACSDAINFLEMNALLREEDNHIYCHLTFFGERHPAIRAYQAILRLDTRAINFSKALQDVSAWWEHFADLKPATVPALARAPLYSTWYQFHQNLEVDILLEECKIARSVGYELIILDDGWQTLDNGRGYDYTGDWKPERIPDMAGFVAAMQDIGMKVGLWFSVPFCGIKSKAYQRFKGKFLTENHRWAPVFDPRYPEVREYLINTYTNALTNWNLDAFKLDFIDDFKVYPETVLTKADGRDYANVNAAVDCLLTDVIQTLKALKPDIAIEFRQQYIGPAMRKFGNMFRAFDCPNDSPLNRIRTTDVKLLCGNTAVHSDPQTWHRDEPVELAAFQVLNGIFGVPQMSVHLRQIPADHFNMIKFYTQYWLDNQSILLDGNFTPYNPHGNYPLLETEMEEKKIIAVFEKMVVDINFDRVVDILNVTTYEEVVLKIKSSLENYQLTIWDCQGEVQEERTISWKKGIQILAVPQSGLLRLSR